MSDTTDRLRIRVQPSSRDPDALHFLLDAPVQPGAGTACLDGPGSGAPLAVALFAIPGVRQVEVEGASIHLRKTAEADWAVLKAPVAAAIRAVLGADAAPLGDSAPDAAAEPDADARLLSAVRALLDDRINPSIASHGGRIAAERVTDGTVFLRMSGGCQGCAASQLTLRGGVERTLRSALPGIKAIIDITDHAVGAKPFYAEDGRTPPAMRSPIAPPRNEPAAAATLAERVRGYLEALPPASPTASYGVIARALGLWLPGSVRKVTRVLEETMREDARETRPFIAARAIGRASGGLPGKGFFDLARELARGPEPGETDCAFHAREIKRLEASLNAERAGFR